MPEKPLWKCPRCGHRFVTKNLWHSCVRESVAAHFRGKPPELRKTWDRLLVVARKSGPATGYAQKTRLVIQARVRFLNVVVRKGHIDAGLWLRRRVAHPRLVRIESYGPLGYGHHFRLERPEDIDAELQTLMQEAYR